MVNNCNSKISNTIGNLRFPMILGVVLIHNIVIEPAKAAQDGMSFLAFFIELMSHQIGSPCVPLFFFISGYLFFLKFGDKFNVWNYGAQLKRRVRTLLIPYLFWNLVVIGYFAFLHKFLPSFMNSDFNNVYQFTTEEFIRSFYDYPGGQPICYQFWFLRDLMLAVIISPLIYVGVKWGRVYLMLLMVALYIYNPSLFPYQAMLTFFSIGAGFAIHRYDFVELAGKYIKLSALLFGILVIVSSLKPEYGQNGISIITGAIVFIWLGSKFKLINRRLTGSVFFIYAFHAFPILVFNRAIVKILHPNGTLMWLGCYVVCFVITIVLSIVFYIALKKFFPKLTTIITGGR